jgi:glucokinase
VKKKNKKTVGPQRLYMGVDIGGTKVQASLVRESGEIIAREKCPTPRQGGPERVVVAIEKAMDDTLRKCGATADDLTAIGIAVPGVVDPDEARVIVAPNMSLTGVDLGAVLSPRFKAPIAVGNDGNFGALGETWLGSARNAGSVLYICVGTGIGSGFVQNGKLWRGCRESAGEIGHMVMHLNGPSCGCGGHGCFESLASRTAIERELRAGIEAGRKSILTELAGGDLSVIRSGMIRKALQAEDPLVCEVMRHAAEVLGYACINVRHLFDPEVIVLGGGVIEACSSFILPIVENIVGRDPLPGAHDGGHVLLSALGDDAVVLGAVAAARRLVHRSPFKKRFAVHPIYSEITSVGFGEITIARKTYDCDIVIYVNGKVKKRDEITAEASQETGHVIDVREVAKVCKGGPEILFIGAGKSGQMPLTDEAQRFLTQRAIRCEIQSTAKTVDSYNKSKLRKAALIHVTC